MAEFKGIDVSVYNGQINWDAVRASGIDFAMIRAGYGSYSYQKDARFEENYQNAKAAGLPVGAYWYSYASTPADAELEARACLEVIKGKRFEYPIAYDIENRFQTLLGRETIDDMINAFCKTVEARKYYVSLYSYRNFLERYVSEEVRRHYDLWIADIDSEPPRPYGIWQYSFSGEVNGICTRVDLDRTEKDYPALITSKGFNGYKLTGGTAC